MVQFVFWATSINNWQLFIPFEVFGVNKWLFYVNHAHTRATHPLKHKQVSEKVSCFGDGKYLCNLPGRGGIKKFGCYVAKIEESEKAGSCQESNPGHLWLEPPVLCATDPWQQPDNNRPSQSAICTAQVVCLSCTRGVCTNFVGLVWFWHFTNGLHTTYSLYCSKFAIMVTQETNINVPYNVLFTQGTDQCLQTK